MHPPPPTSTTAAGNATPPSADWTIDQGWASYTAAEHATWKTLFERQSRLLPGRACDDFLSGLKDLPLRHDQIPDFERLSDVLHKRIGWRVVGVPGLVPDEVFFDHLAHRRFPAGQFIRRPGPARLPGRARRVPRRVRPRAHADAPGRWPSSSRPMGQGARAPLKEGVLDLLARVYWYTVEFGLVRQPDGLRIYGAGIVSSATESVFALEDASPNRCIGFELERVMRTRYRIDDFQQRTSCSTTWTRPLALAHTDFTRCMRA